MTFGLLLLHILFGGLALLSVFICFASKKGGKTHRRFGKLFCLSMAIALMAALVLSIIRENYFLLLVGIFSAYLVYTGWRVGASRERAFTRLDWTAMMLMLVSSAVMVAIGATGLVSGKDDMSLVILVFGAIGGALSLSDYRRPQEQGVRLWPKGVDRIALHIIRISAASISTITAVMVVNVNTDPAFIAWLLPTVVIVPVIFYWTRRIGSGNGVL